MNEQNCSVVTTQPPPAWASVPVSAWYAGLPANSMS